MAQVLLNSNLISRNISLKVALLAVLFSILFSSIGFIQAFLVNGEFCYALDDSFIMMAISKNLAFHNVWGLTQHEFSSTASSPLFTVILAGFIWLFGDHVWMPLAINIFALTGFFLWVALRCRIWGFNQWQIWIMLMGLFYFMPIPVLLFGSMEHILHTWIALFCLQQVIENEDKLNPFLLFLMGACLSGIRYEGLFEGGVIVLWFWKNKKWFLGFVFGLGLSFPVLWLGIYSISQGWFFLPNSLILKGYGMNIQETRSVWGYLWSIVMKAANHPHVIIPVVMLYLISGYKESSKHKNQIWISLVMIASILHFIFARYNHVYRYEAYLMAMGWLVIWKVICQSQWIKSTADLVGFFRSKYPQPLIGLIFLFSPLYRSLDSFSVGTRAMVNIFEQQVQSARFIHQFYNTASVGAIDVGAIAYYSDCKLLDIWGLGSMEMAMLKIKGRYLAGPVDHLCRKKKMEMAVVYKKKLGHPSWVKIASWVMLNNAVCSADTIDFIAINPDDRIRLRQNLIKFDPSLPKTVKSIFYP